MRTVLTKTLLTLAACAVAAFADDSLGTWKLNLEKSTYTPAPIPVKSLTVTRAAAAGGVKVTMAGQRADGTPINAGYTAKYDGAPATVTGTGSSYDLISVKQIDASTFTDERKKASGRYHVVGRTAISNGGRTMTSMTKGVDAEGKVFSSAFVFDKQ